MERSPLMVIITDFINLFLHLDKNIGYLVQNFGIWTYLVLFAIIFAETGLVVTPFLPGDSLLFAAGAIASTGALDITRLAVTLVFAAVIGDSVNYAIGKYIGVKLFDRANGRFLKREYLDRTHKFYEKYGGKTIILARFVPIIRTFAPFVAGVGRMSYGHFFAYNVIGGILWVAIFALGGFFFGNMPIIKKNFSIVIFIIIFISVLPAVIEFLRHRKMVDSK